MSVKKATKDIRDQFYTNMNEDFWILLVDSQLSKATPANTQNGFITLPR